MSWERHPDDARLLAKCREEAHRAESEWRRFEQDQEEARLGQVSGDGLPHLRPRQGQETIQQGAQAF